MYSALKYGVISFSEKEPLLRNTGSACYYCRRDQLLLGFCKQSNGNAVNINTFHYIYYWLSQLFSLHTQMLITVGFWLLAENFVSAFSIGIGIIQTENSGIFCDHFSLVFLISKQNSKIHYPHCKFYFIFCFWFCFFSFVH